MSHHNPLLESLRNVPGVSILNQTYLLGPSVGEGTFGQVHKATYLATSQLVALKRLRTDKEQDGFPFTAIREIKILRRLNHPNIVKLLDVAVSESGPNKLDTYLVFPYTEHDLCGLLGNEDVVLDMGTVKMYAQQLLDGLHYLHTNNIIHRDLKTANLLVSNSGALQIADFGLTRQYEPVWNTAQTPLVVTRWYRPPELLLGFAKYTCAIDMWGVGCILIEMIYRNPYFQADSDLNQLRLIFQVCGTPSDSIWPEWSLMIKRRYSSSKDHHQQPFVTFSHMPRKLVECLRTHVFPKIRTSDHDEMIKLIDQLLSIHPDDRPHAYQCLDHAFFTRGVRLTEKSRIPVVHKESHELDVKTSKDAARRQQRLQRTTDPNAVRPTPPKKSSDSVTHHPSLPTRPAISNSLSNSVWAPREQGLLRPT